MSATASSTLDGVALEAWRSYLGSHAAIVRELDAELVAAHAMTVRDYEVLLYLSQAEQRSMAMSELADRTMLTRSGVTRLIDGLVENGWIDRVPCSSDARKTYAQLTDAGYEKLRKAGGTHIGSIKRVFLDRYTADELEQLATLLQRLPGGQIPGSCTAASDGCAVEDAAPPAGGCAAE